MSTFCIGGIFCVLFPAFESGFRGSPPRACCAPLRGFYSLLSAFSMALAIFGSFFFALRDAAPRARSGRPGAAGPFGSIVRSATPLMRATVNFLPALLSFFCSGPVVVSWSTRQAFRPAATNQQHFESLSGVRRRILGGPPIHRPTDGCFSLCPGLFFRTDSSGERSGGSTIG